MANGEETEAGLSTLGILKGEIVATGRVGVKFLFFINLICKSLAITRGSLMSVFLAVTCLASTCDLPFTVTGVVATMTERGRGEALKSVLCMMMALIFLAEYLGPLRGDFLLIVLILGLSRWGLLTLPVIL